jgi:hypothetical protein
MRKHNVMLTPLIRDTIRDSDGQGAVYLNGKKLVSVNDKKKVKNRGAALFSHSVIKR